MATFVHLTSAAHAPRIRRAGIRADSRDRDGARGVYCFPVLPSYALTHQWLRELARRGTRGGLVAVHLRLDDAEPVTVGRYDRPPERVTAAGAVGRIRELADPRGWEVFLPRAVTAREVQRVRNAPQVSGWRYFPEAHGRVPCTCPRCLTRGEYGSRRLRERRQVDGPPPPPRVLLARIEAAGVPGDPAALRDALQWFGGRRRGPLPALARLAHHPDPGVREDLVRAVGHWRTPGVAALLDGLAEDPCAGVREAVEAVRD